MSHKYCPRYKVALKADDEGSKLIYRPRCKMWDCPYCAVLNKRIWLARIFNEVKKSGKKLWYFWTLTLDGDDHQGNTAYSLQVWREVWDKLMKRIRRDLGNIKYIRIFETHKDGTLHVHMLTSHAYSDRKKRTNNMQKVVHESATLAKHLDELGLGWVHDIKLIRTKESDMENVGANVGAYITKYMTKDLQGHIRKELKDAGMGRIRMIQTSRGWCDEPEEKHDKLEWEAEPLYKHEYLAIPRQKKAYDISRDYKITIDDFYDYPHFPNAVSDLVDEAQRRDEE